MEFDVDKAVQLLDPWDFGLIIDGMTCPTRRPNVAEVGQLERLGEMTPAEGYALLGSLFDTQVDVRNFGQERVAGFLVAYMTYFRARALKNSQAISTQVRATMGAKAPQANSGA